MKPILLALLAAATLPAAAAAMTPAPSPKVSITLPGDLGFQLKPGPGSQLAVTHCLTCHSSAYVSTQPVLDLAHWTAEVNKMRKVYGANIPENDVEGIATYLAQAYAAPSDTAK